MKIVITDPALTAPIEIKWSRTGSHNTTIHSTHGILSFHCETPEEAVKQALLRIVHG